MQACNSAPSPGYGGRIHMSRFSMAWEGGKFSPANICRAGPFLLARVQWWRIHSWVISKFAPGSTEEIDFPLA